MTQPKQFTKADLKTGMVVETREEVEYEKLKPKS